MQDLPKYHQTFFYIIQALQDGQAIGRNELCIKVRDTYYKDMPENLKSLTTKTGANKFLDRIAWGISYLKMGGFVIYPNRGWVQISAKGKNQLAKKSLTLQDLKADTDFINYQQRVNKSKNIQESLADQDPQALIEDGLKTIEDQVKDELLEKLKEINPYDFERLVLILLNKMGYGEFEETPKSRDGGIDGIINEDALGLDKIYIQAKRYQDTPITEKHIRDFIGAISRDAQKGIFITTSEFSNSAIEKAKDAIQTIVLIDGYKIVDLMYEYNVGIQIKTLYEVKSIDKDFFDVLS